MRKEIIYPIWNRLKEENKWLENKLQLLQDVNDDLKTNMNSLGMIY